jgi:hypothetical protein
MHPACRSFSYSPYIRLSVEVLFAIQLKDPLFSTGIFNPCLR